MYPNYDYERFESKINEALAWIEESELMPSETKEHFQSLVHSLSEQAEEATYDGPVYAGGNEYIIAAELSAEGAEPQTTVPYPVDYTAKEQYWPDRQPKVEEMVTSPLMPGEIMKLTWANGDDYDGLSYRVGVERKLRKAIVDYLKKLGLWDIIHETMYDNPLQEDSTRFHRLPSPYDPSRTMTWGIKRPANYDGTAVSLAYRQVLIVFRLKFTSTSPTCTGLTPDASLPWKTATEPWQMLALMMSLPRSESS